MVLLPVAVESPKNSIPVFEFVTVPIKPPVLSNAVIDVLATASKKPPVKPTAATGVEKSMLIGPLYVGLPLRTGDVGVEMSVVINVGFADKFKESGPVGEPPKETGNPAVRD